MKKMIIVAIIVAMAAVTACSKVPAGYVGVKVNLYGSVKGVNADEIGPGRYWIGMNEELYVFPTFTQNYVWTASKTEGSPNDESITFQTREGMSVNADVGISYHINPDKVATIFQRYRKGIEEITDIYLRNIVRDAFNQYGSQVNVESVYGSGKNELLKNVDAAVKQSVADIGIVVEKIYLSGSIRLPNQVVAALNRKIEATQRAEQRENELREAEAEAKKKVAESRGEAAAVLTRAKAQAEANIILSRSITSELIKYEATKKWDGKLPKFSGGQNIPMISVFEEK